jgi:hypothetical protein
MHRPKQRARNDLDLLPLHQSVTEINLGSTHDRNGP